MFKIISRLFLPVVVQRSQRPLALCSSPCVPGAGVSQLLRVGCGSPWGRREVSVQYLPASFILLRWAKLKFCIQAFLGRKV